MKNIVYYKNFESILEYNNSYYKEISVDEWEKYIISNAYNPNTNYRLQSHNSNNNVNYTMSELRYINSKFPNFKIEKNDLKCDTIIINLKQGDKKISSDITKLPDEFYVVNLSKSEYQKTVDTENSVKYFKCDQIDGVVKCIMDSWEDFIKSN